MHLGNFANRPEVAHRFDLCEKSRRSGTLSTEQPTTWYAVATVAATPAGLKRTTYTILWISIASCNRGRDSGGTETIIRRSQYAPAVDVATVAATPAGLKQR